MTDVEIRKMAAEALLDFDTDRHYIVTVTYGDGINFSKTRCWVSCFLALDEVLDSLLNDDVLDVDITATSMEVEDLSTLGVNVETPEFF